MKKNITNTNNNAFFILTSLLTLVAIPEVSLALTLEDLSGFFVGEIVNSVVVLIIGIAVVYFLWGIAKYILHSGDPKVREEGRDMMIYGVMAIFVMVSVWGFVNLLDNTFKLNNSTLPDPDDFLP